MTQSLIYSLLAWLIFLISTNTANALPPPDIVMHVVSQAGVYIAMGAAVISTLFVSSYQYCKSFYLKYKYPSIIGGIFFIVLFIIGSYYIVTIENEKNMLLQRNLTINSWLSYKDTETNSKYENLSYDEKVELLLSLSGVEIDEWLFDGESVENLTSSISREELQNIMETNNSEYKLLDARENIEYEIGNIPGSEHYRLGELKLSETWKELSNNHIYVVLCWTGIRGELVANFLASKGIQAVYLEGGIEEWTKEKMPFTGETEIAEAFENSQYKQRLTIRDFLKYIESGAKLIDAREQYRLQPEDMLEDADNIFLMYSSDAFLEERLSHYTPEDEIIVICNDYVNCFDGQLIGITLEQRGLNLKGMYIKKGIVK